MSRPRRDQRRGLIIIQMHVLIAVPSDSINLDWAKCDAMLEIQKSKHEQPTWRFLRAEIFVALRQASALLTDLSLVASSRRKLLPRDTTNKICPLELMG